MIQNIAFFFLFLTQKTANLFIRRILSFLSLCCALILAEEFLGFTYGFEQYPHMILATSPLWYLLAPLLYFYLRAQIKGHGLKWIDLLHLSPFLIVLFGSMDFYTFSGEAKLNYLESFRTGQFIAPVHNAHYILFFLQSIAYLGVCIWIFKTNASTKKIQMWQKICLICLLAFSLMGLTAIWFANTKSQFLIHLSADSFVVWLALFNLGILIQSIRYPNQLYFKLKERKAAKPEWNTHLIMDNINQYMEQQHPYRDPNYNIHQLVKALGYSKNQLEQIIKSNTNLNFRDFLNEYRIEEAKQKLVLPENHRFTIQSIAEEVGFKSSATFYRVFKKREGLTPKALMKSKIPDSSSK